MKKYNLLLVWSLLLVILFSPSEVKANPAGPSTGSGNIYTNPDGTPNNGGTPSDSPDPSTGNANSGQWGGSNLGGSSDKDEKSCVYEFSANGTYGKATIKVVDGKLDIKLYSLSGSYNIALSNAQTHLSVSDFENGCPSKSSLVFACTATGQTRQCYINTTNWVEDNVGDPWENDSDWEQLGEEVDINDFNNPTVGCPDIINMEEGKLGWLLNTILNYIRIIGPVLVVLLSAIDFIKAVLGTDEKAMKEAQNKLIIRLVAAVALFLVPTLVQLLLSFINASTCTVG